MESISVVVSILLMMSKNVLKIYYKLSYFTILFVLICIFVQVYVYVCMFLHINIYLIINDQIIPMCCICTCTIIPKQMK